MRSSRLRTSLGRTAAVGFATAALLTGCLAGGSCSGAGTSASASCAAGVEYEGHFYVEWSSKLPVAKGRLLGDAGYPTCDDGGGCTEAGAPRPTRVWAMRGVDPRQVVVGREEGSDRFVVFGRLHADPKDYFRFAHGAWHVGPAAPGGR